MLSGVCEKRNRSHTVLLNLLVAVLWTVDIIVYPCSGGVSEMWFCVHQCNHARTCLMMFVQSLTREDSSLRLKNVKRMRKYISLSVKALLTRSCHDHIRRWMRTQYGQYWVNWWAFCWLRLHDFWFFKKSCINGVVNFRCSDSSWEDRGPTSADCH